MDDSLIRVELSGETLTVSEPTHMSWDEVHHRLIIIYTLMTYYWSSCVCVGICLSLLACIIYTTYYLDKYASILLGSEQ